MDSKGLARGKKNAIRVGATIIFIDESGLLMAPLVRRTWAPRGVTPVLSHRTRHRQKVSVIAGLCWRQGEEVRQYFRLHPNENINTRRILAFLCQLFRHIDGPVTIIWDRLNSHRSPRVRAYVERRPNSQIVFLPPYAPELNPVEYVWGNWKMNPLVNLAALTLDDLVSAVRSAAFATQRRQQLLSSFLRHSPLSFLP